MSMFRADTFTCQGPWGPSARSSQYLHGFGSTHTKSPSVPIDPIFHVDCSFKHRSLDAQEVSSQYENLTKKELEVAMSHPVRVFRFMNQMSYEVDSLTFGVNRQVVSYGLYIKTTYHTSRIESFLTCNRTLYCFTRRIGEIWCS